jgi:predicted DNA-binding ribbon-helix-helix protein
MLGGPSVAPATQAWASAGFKHPVGVFHMGRRERHNAVHRAETKRRCRKHKTSISLEDEFWTSAKEIAASRQSTCSGLLSEINEHRKSGNLSSAIRLFVLQFYEGRARQVTG